MIFTEKKFDIPTLIGISDKTITEHLKLYAGYIKHANLIQSLLDDLYLDQTKNYYQIHELHRRFSFEFDGMRNHEIYFEQFTGGKISETVSSSLSLEILNTWGSFDVWLIQFKSLCMTRGVGWAFLIRDRKSGKLINTWIEEQHLGHLVDTDIIFAIDMWEHSYMLDYVPSEKKNYIDACFNNLNFSVLEQRFCLSIKNN